jgi:hypothetical protein
MQGYIWPSKQVPDHEFLRTYRYQKGKTILMDTTAIHGGLLASGAAPGKLRAIFNMGFQQDYAACRKVLQNVSAEEIFS